VGDFNEIISDSEKFGGARKPRGQMADFRRTLEHCQLSDLGFPGRNSLGAIIGRVINSPKKDWTGQQAP
jgi:hypothetical protein